MQFNSGPGLISWPVDSSSFIKDFTNSVHHSLFGLGQMKVGILSYRLCPQVKMLFMSYFNSSFLAPLCPLRYTSLSLASIPSFHFHRLVEWGRRQGTPRRGKNDEVWGVTTPVESKRSKHFQACVMDSCGTTVIKIWMSLRGCGLQSISYRSLGPSLLIDWSPGAAAPFCNVHCIITIQKLNSFNKHKNPCQTPTHTCNTCTLEMFCPRDKSSVVKWLNEFYS